MRADSIDHRPFDRSHVGQGRALFQRRGDFGGDIAHNADRNAENHKVSPRDGLGRGVANPVAQADLAGDVTGFGAAGMADNLGSHAGAADRMGDRSGDQSQPDQGNAGIWVLHQRAPLNTAMAWTTRRQALSSPTVMRRASGRP